MVSSFGRSLCTSTPRGGAEFREAKLSTPASSAARPPDLARQAASGVTQPHGCDESNARASAKVPRRWPERAASRGQAPRQGPAGHVLGASCGGR
jgi:hypothetical protein